MARPCIPQFFQLSLFILLLFTTIWCSSVTGHAAERQFKGEVGGNVTIECPFNGQKKITLFYLQRGDDFVNGYYEGSNMSTVPKWENTKVSQNATVYISNLNLSHSGIYRCLIRYEHEAITNKDVVQLIVTAKYSQPNLTVEEDGSLTCVSHGGYPEARIVWNPAHRLEQIVWHTPQQDSYTDLFNITSSAKLNCSSGKLNVSCSVGNFTSDEVSLCISMEPPHISNVPTIVGASIMVLIVPASVIAVLYCRRKKKRTAPLSNSKRPEELSHLNKNDQEGGEP